MDVPHILTTYSKPSGFERKENCRKARFEPYGTSKPIIQWTSPNFVIMEFDKIKPIKQEVPRWFLYFLINYVQNSGTKLLTEVSHFH
jgi:hypothetical protein